MKKLCARFRFRRLLKSMAMVGIVEMGVWGVRHSN